MGPAWRLVNWFGGTPAGVWTIKHVISPLDRRLYRRTGGRLVTPGHPHGPIVLLTTIGRRTGHQHTTPVFHLQDGERIILCNVTPPGERANPWTLNLRAQPLARVQLAGQVRTYRARPATEAELKRYWPQLLRVWPAYERFYRQGGRRSVFVLDPTTAVEPPRRGGAGSTEDGPDPPVQVAAMPASPEPGSSSPAVSYAAYLLHAPILVLVSLATRPLPLPLEAKSVLVAAAGVAAAFSVGWMVTRSALPARFA